MHVSSSRLAPDLRQLSHIVTSPKPTPIATFRLKHLTTNGRLKSKAKGADARPEARKKPLFFAGALDAATVLRVSYQPPRFRILPKRRCSRCASSAFFIYTGVSNLMASAAQMKANRENAKKSQGPVTEEGKQACSQNNLCHGLTGHLFVLMSWENPENFEVFHAALRNEHKPATLTEFLLVEKMAQQQWLSQRAQMLLTEQLSLEVEDEELQKEIEQKINKYLRYQTQHERLFQRALHDLLKLRAEKRKEQIGFESQKAAEAKQAAREVQETRRAAAETRKAEDHKITMDIKTKRLEREKSLAMIAGMKAGDQLSKIMPPNWQELLAAA
jgi:hypothetical protein